MNTSFAGRNMDGFLRSSEQLRTTALQFRTVSLRYLFCCRRNSDGQGHAGRVEAEAQGPPPKTAQLTKKVPDTFLIGLNFLIFLGNGSRKLDLSPCQEVFTAD